MHSFRELIRHPEFRRAFKETAGANVGICAWGLVMGVGMIQAGMSIPVALFMSVAIYSGGAQVAALPLIVGHAPLWLIMLTAACVNLRFIIFSAQWRPFVMHLSLAKRLAWGYLAADPPYVTFMRRFGHGARGPGPGQTEFYLGGAIPAWLSWQVMSLVGVLLSNVIPTSWGLTFAGALALMGLAFSQIGNVTAALVAVIASATGVIAFGVPFRLYTVIAIVVGVGAGLMLERRGRVLPVSSPTAVDTLLPKEPGT